MTVTLVFVWYFYVASGVVGPFRDQRDCDEVRLNPPNKYVYTSKCWQAPMPAYGWRNP
jgi:hypothetical protein